MIYTGQGDKGDSFIGRQRLGKADIRFELVGDLDELSSFIGLAKAKITDGYLLEYFAFLETVQQNLSLIAASIHDSQNESYQLSETAISGLEAKIDYMQGISPTNSFILPGGCELSALLDVCRCVARRTERCFCTAVTGDAGKTAQQIDIKQVVLAYLNRLSDFLFAFARYADYLWEIEAAVKKTLTSLSEKTSVERISYMFDNKKCGLIMTKIEERAKEMNLSVAIAFCDSSGNPVLASSAQGAFIVSFDYAIRKAYTAVALKMTTENAQTLIQPGNTFYGLSDERILAIPGGTLITHNGEIIGGIGVSGGDGKQDAELCEYGARMFMALCND